MRTIKGLRSSQPLFPDVLRKTDAYWRADNSLSAGPTCRCGNPLLKQPLNASHVKPRLRGQWGATPGLNSAGVRPSRIISERDLLTGRRGEDQPEISNWRWTVAGGGQHGR